jgi:endonuclease III-like uncharacterized protein
MNVLEIVQSILTYFCTAGFVSAVAYFFRLSKRVTILEEHDKDQIKAVERVDTLSDKLTRIDTKLDLLLEGKINTKEKE